MLVKKTYKAGDKQVILKADRNLFAKMILIGQTRKLDMRDVLSHSLGPIPWALATPAGTLRKTAKCVLAKKAQEIPVTSGINWAILYVMHGTFALFKDMPQIIMFYYKIEIYVF